jgi:molybdopterin molybdotransferase
MLSVEQALHLVLDQTVPLLPGPRCTIDSRRRVLAEPVISDIDSPPHDKSIVDGYAIIAADATAPGAELTVIEEVTAGAVSTRTVERGTATRIMTGAPIPAGADAVVMIEKATLSGERVRIDQTPVNPGQNIMRRATSLSRGQVVLEPGKVLRAIEMGLLAEIGRETVLVIPPPRVAVLPTGNELVPAGTVPGPGQIRDSNGALLQGLVGQAGGAPVPPSGIARDDLDELRQHVSRGLTCDILLLSGGVSAGVLDLVPQVLAELGVEQVFHKVNLKPGKPLWFGVKRHAETGRQTLVFGLPGNPVSGLVCFELFVRPAIEKLSGREPKGLPRVSAMLTKEHKQRGERPAYWPAVLVDEGDERRVTPLPWQGSGDLRTLSDANCLAVFPPGERVFLAGENVTVLLLETH